MRRDNSICVTYTAQKDKLSEQETWALLDSVGIPTSSLQTVQALNATSFDLTFRTLHDRKLYGGKLSALQYLDVRVYGSAETVVTATRIPDEFDDNHVRHWLSRYGQVLASRMTTYRDRPTVRNGNRQYKVILKPGANIPSSWRLADGRLAFFRYVGQQRTCLKCYQEGHEAAQCTVIFCNKCQLIGHTSAECSNQVVCNQCGKEGHTARRCPTSYANKLLPDNKWTSGPAAEATVASAKTPGQSEQSQVNETVSSGKSQSEQTNETDSSDSGSEESGEDDSAEEFASSDELTEKERELLLEATQPSPSSAKRIEPNGEQETAHPRNKKRKKRKGKAKNGRKQNNEVEESQSQTPVKNVVAKKKAPHTGDPSSDAMEVDQQTSKRPAPSDEEVSPKRKSEPSTVTKGPHSPGYDLPLSGELAIDEFTSSGESL
ncbi:uncharacterized protein LOC144862029 [Branchiostoma floridae x Branchiostoma japonicum]